VKHSEVIGFSVKFLSSINILTLERCKAKLKVRTDAPKIMKIAIDFLLGLK
jgi:hypothetical protein